MNSRLRTYRIHVDGIVQGVGFRPFVYRLAQRYGLTGWVRNSSLGVDIEVTGPLDALEAFSHALQTEAPPLAHIHSVHLQEVDPPHTPTQEFRIIPSEKAEGFTLVSPDVATCADCLAEVLDPANRRYRYPFTNCTNCGPRFSIIRRLPYDRPHTTMAAFPMCPECQAEYEDPLNRRFHAQPNACPRCGPHVWLEVKPPWEAHVPEEAVDDIARTAALLRKGAIVAIKGLGGFHLACDATQSQAVRRLRQRKPRPHKPLALMMRDVEMVREYAHLTPEAEALLTSPAAPIVLLPPREGTNLAPEVAPGQRTIGVMLPYTPLHHLLLRDAQVPLVMTSGNRTDEPIAYTNELARSTLDPIVDAFLWHNRPIHNRVDDSVWTTTAAGSMPIRRARGYAPYPLPLPIRARDPILAMGSYMKNTFCLVSGSHAFLSQHIGEMEYASTWEFFTESLSRFMDLFGIRPRVVAHDAHPDFTALAHEVLQDVLALEEIRWVAVQHHHAHVAACLADNQIVGDVIGIILDGTGYGGDGTIWGGEILVANERTYRRVGRIAPFPLPGGDSAIRAPWRVALALVKLALGDIPPTVLDQLDVPPSVAQIVLRQVERGINAPLTSSCGRLFDAVAALLGIRREITYEGQAAIELETVAASFSGIRREAGYPVPVTQVDGLWTLDAGAIIRHVLQDMATAVEASRVAYRFHRTIARALVEMAERVREETGLSRVVLSGGCFQNRLLLEELIALLQENGFTVYTHRHVPPNDGGLSLGQALIAAATL